MSALDQVDREIVHEDFDSERAIRVLGRVLVNQPALLAEVFPYALAALVDARIRAIKPPRGMPKPEHKRARRPRG